MKKLEMLRSIPIKEVSDELGLVTKRVGEDTWAVYDPARKELTSLVLFGRVNRFKRYSADKTGSVIDLVMEIRGVEFKEACEFLSISFPQYA